MSDLVMNILKQYGETDQDNVWKVQNATVIKHACLERVAAKAKIRFGTPNVLRCERDEAVILVTGEMEERAEWSIGEARTVPMVDTGRKNNYGKPIYEPADGAIGNYQVTPKQAAYPYAMAEKRAKDRVILKLIGLHGLAYSEDEADDFKEQPALRPAPSERAATEQPPGGVTARQRSFLDIAAESLRLCISLQGVDDWVRENAAGATAAGIVRGSEAAIEMRSLVETTKDVLSKRRAA